MQMGQSELLIQSLKLCQVNKLGESLAILWRCCYLENESVDMQISRSGFDWMNKLPKEKSDSFFDLFF